MSKYVLFILLLFFSINLSSQEVSGSETISDIYDKASPEQKKEIREKYFDEFLDAEMFLDVIASRRFNYVDDASLADKFGNRKLHQTINFFTEKSKMRVCIYCKIDKEHFWVKWMGTKGRVCNRDTMAADKILYINILLKPQASDPRYYKAGISAQPMHPFGWETYYLDSNHIRDFEAYMSDTLPLLKREEFIPRLNEKVVTGLLKLLGNEVTPITITFTPEHPRAYDTLMSGKTRSFYPDYQLHGENRKSFWVPVKKGEPLTIKADIKQSLEDSTERKIEIKLNGSTKAIFSNQDSSGTIKLSDFRTGDHTLQAVYKAEDNNADILAGQVNIVAYEQKTFNVVFVPLKGAAVPLQDIAERELNRIYSQAVVEWKVSIDSRLSEYTQKVSSGSLITDNSYHETMNKVIKEFQSKGNYDEKSFYIFLVPGFYDHTDRNMVLGYMPLMSQFGFVEIKADKTTEQHYRSIAHQLGHGAFGLKHTFLPEYDLRDGLNHFNLMGYNDSARLCKFQWDEIQKIETVDFKDTTKAEKPVVVQCFLIEKDTLESKSDFYTVKTLKEENTLKVVFNCDSSIIDSLIWKTGKNEIAAKTNQYAFPCRETGKKTIDIYKNNIKIAQLNITVCDKAIVKFNKDYNNYNGEFGFDDGSELTSTNDYDKFKIDKVNYTVPWLSILPTQEVELVLNIDLKKNLEKDKNFKIAITSSHPGKIGIDGQDKLELDYAQLKGKKSLEIKSRTDKGFHDRKHVIDNSHYVYAIDNKGDTLGKLNVVCNESRKQKIVFVYVKHNHFKYRTDVNTQDLITYLNKYSHNQLFINIIKDDDYIIDTLDISAEYKGASHLFATKEDVLGRMENMYRANIGTYIRSEDDNAILFFITNMNLGNIGGAMNFMDGIGFVTSVGVTPHICHELGHGVGLAHPFCCLMSNEKADKRCIEQISNHSRCKAQGTTQNNYMDYINSANMKMYFFYQWLFAKPFEKRNNK